MAKEEKNEEKEITVEEKIDIEKIKRDIDLYVRERVDAESASNAVKLYKQQIRRKNIANFVKDIIIVFLVLGISLGVYLLYKDNYFEYRANKERYVLKDSTNNDNNKSNENREINNDNSNVNNDDNKKEEDSKVNLDEMIDKYSYLLKNINMNSKCDYLQDYYSGNLTLELKEYLAYSLIDKDKISTDDDSSYFEGKILLDNYKKLFNDSLSYKSFKVNGVNYKYLSSKDMFISSEILTDGEDISREIINVELDNDKVVLTCVEGYVKNNKLYNVLTGKEVSGYSEGDKLFNYGKKLNEIKYVFEKDYLIDIK